MVDVSVAICTYNRVVMLQETLASFAAQHAHCRVAFELLVVDNNSADGTAAAVAAFASSHPEIPTRYLHEPRQGLSRARNSAAEEASGEVLVYCDDDVYFDSNLVDAYADAFRADDNLVALAGRIDPHFEAPRPPWLSDKLLRPYSITLYGDAARMLAVGEHPVGANMAIRRRNILACDGFSLRLGRDGKSLLSNEETELFTKIRQLGGAFGYLPAARLRHRIPPDRLTEDWLLSRIYWQGVSDAVLEAQAGSHSRKAALRGAWADLSNVLRVLRPKTLDPRAWYWHLRRPGVAAGMHLAYSWGRARARLKAAVASSGA